MTYDKHVAELVTAGAMTPDWRPSFRAVPRSVFIPDLIWSQDEDTTMFRPVHRATDPERWEAEAHGTEPVVTQVDDGHPATTGGVGDIPTSSASMPLMVATMLKHLDVEPGHRVLEIGTGTGWNAALLAHRLGAEQVTTIEIDPDVAADARVALDRNGFGAVCTVVGDGELGHPGRAPYDSVIATASCAHVPYAWVTQTRPGGRLVTPWSDDLIPCGGLLVLTGGDDGTATGTFMDTTTFMRLRGQRRPVGTSVRDMLGETEDHAEKTTSRVHPYYLASHLGVLLAIRQRVPGCRLSYVEYSARYGEGVVWFHDRETGSWAGHFHRTPDISDDEFEVLQYGTRRLWDEVDATIDWWVDAGKPEADRWRFTVTPDGQWIEPK